MRTASETPQWALLSLCEAIQSGQVAVDNYAGGEVAFIQSLTSGELRRLPGMLGGYRRHRGTLGGIML
jgi:hypothetical protein